MDSSLIELVSNASAQVFLDSTLSCFTTFFAGVTESGKSIEGCIFQKFLANNEPKGYRGKVKVF